MAQTKKGAILVFCGRYGITYEYYMEQINKGLKWCSGCKKFIDRNYFISDKSRVDGLSTKCKDCTRVKEKVNRHLIPSSFKGRHHSEQSKKKMSESHKGKISKLKGIPRSETVKQKISKAIKLKALRGPDNPNWKGGVSNRKSMEMAKFEYQVWRRSVFERDKYICQICGYDKGKILEAHHINAWANYPELRFDVNNGTTLCKFCHRIIHTKDKEKIAKTIKQRRLVNEKN